MRSDHQVRRFLFTCFIIQCCFYQPYAQDAPLTAPVVEQALENLTENNEDAETEDDAYLQQMQHFIKDPVNLNTADENDLNELKVLTPLQINSLISYRSLFGQLIDIYELQAIPGWDVQLIQKIRPYITVAGSVSGLASLRARFKKGENTLLSRVTQVLPKSKGYLPGMVGGGNLYRGSPQKLLVRYKYQYKNILQYGITAEKDAGEQFFNGKQKTGLIFILYIFLREILAL